jgi:hypothetical protein
MNSKEILKMYCKEKYDNEIVIKTYSIQEIVQIIDFTKQLMLGGVVGQSEQLSNEVLETAIAKAKPNMDKINDVDEWLDSIR